MVPLPVWECHYTLLPVGYCITVEPWVGGGGGGGGEREGQGSRLPQGTMRFVQGASGTNVISNVNNSLELCCGVQTRLR